GVVLGSIAWVRDAEERRRQAQVEAEGLRRHDEAREQVAKFHGKIDDMMFYAASTNPVAERTPYYRPDKAEELGQTADTGARAWGPALENLALPEQERGPVKEDVADFLLLRAQLKVGAPGAGPESARQARALLDRAHSLQEPSRGSYLLAAACSQALGEAERAAREQKQADDPATRITALDHFLLGEQARRRATGPA